ncbi:MAG: BatD family protein [Candidatus Neomarinimicrobiota bacterium]
MVNYIKNTMLILLILSTGVLWGQKITCSFSKTNFTMQEEVQITFSFEDIKNAPRSVDLKLEDTFSIVGGPYSSQNFSWVNGKSTSSNTLSYDLIPLKSGRIKIPEYQFKIKNKVYQTDAFFVNISKNGVSGDAGTGSMPDIFIQTELKKNEFYQGETFTIDYQLFTAENVVNYTTNPVSRLEGFIIDQFKKNSSPAASKRIINGKEYLVANIASLTLTPTQPGRKILPVKAFRIAIKSREQSRSFFNDPFFGSSTKDINIVSPLDTVNILQLPDHSGAAFSGAIGEFKMSVSIDSTMIQENQATALRVELSGHGNMDHFTFPSQAFADEFEVFEPKVKDEYTLKNNDYVGKRYWEYVLIPSTPGVYRFDDILFTYFSPRKKQYVTLRGELPVLKVLSHNELEGDYRSTLTPEEVRLLSKDIRFLQMEERRSYLLNEDPLKNSRIWTFYYISLGLILSLVFCELYRIYRKKNMETIRYKNAFKNIIAEMQKINDKMESSEVLGIIEASFLQYIEDKNIRKFAYPELTDIIKTIETYKYAPGSISHAQLNELKDQCLSMVEKMELV